MSLQSSRNIRLLYVPVLLLLGILMGFYTTLQPPKASDHASDIIKGVHQATLPNITLTYFPQSKQCNLGWMQDYMQLHADILQQKLPPRHFVSVAIEAGLADRITGLVTQFWHAVLTRRTFSTISHGTLPRWEAICDTPFVNWTTPAPGVPPEAIEPFKNTTYRGHPGDTILQRVLPQHLPRSKYQSLYAVNYDPPVAAYRTKNLSSLMSPDPEYIIGAANRGRTYQLGLNPYHKQQLWDLGVNPGNMFMCGFFALCSPTRAVVDYYSKFWDVLLDPNTVKIGVQIRVGDHVFRAGESDTVTSPDAVLTRWASYFECAAQIENTFVAPGQRVLWFLNSDSRQLRKAAKAKYGAKLITDHELVMAHPDCTVNSNKQLCQHSAIDNIYQHSLGSLLTFSMVDYHIITNASGFGRLAAWLSGRWTNIYELTPGQRCDPNRPTPPETSAQQWSGV